MQRDEEEDHFYASSSREKQKLDHRVLVLVITLAHEIYIITLVARLPALVVSEDVGCPREVLESTHGHHIWSI